MFFYHSSNNLFYGDFDASTYLDVNPRSSYTNYYISEQLIIIYSNFREFVPLSINVLCMNGIGCNRWVIIIWDDRFANRPLAILNVFHILKKLHSQRFKWITYETWILRPSIRRTSANKIPATISFIFFSINNYCFG